jgi:hypothetical protein
MFTKTKIFNFLTALAFSALLTASIVYASTTINTDITTGGTLTVSGTATSTSGGKLQWDGYNSAGTRYCIYLVDTTWTFTAGACNP